MSFICLALFEHRSRGVVRPRCHPVLSPLLFDEGGHGLSVSLSVGTCQSSTTDRLAVCSTGGAVCSRISEASSLYRLTFRVQPTPKSEFPECWLDPPFLEISGCVIILEDVTIKRQLTQPNSILA